MFQDGRCNTSPTSPYYNVTIDSFGRIHSLRATSGHHYLVSGTFHPPIGVLFSFPSRYFYSIGLETYLELGVDASHIQTRYPTDPTREQYKDSKKNISTGLSPSTVLKFQIEFDLSIEAKSKVYTPHLPQITKWDSVCSESFSLAVTNDIAYCFLFLHLLRCFNSVGSQSSRINTKVLGSPIRQSWVQKMYAPRPSLSQLTTTFIGNSSQAIPQIAQVAKF